MRVCLATIFVLVAACKSSGVAVGGKCKTSTDCAGRATCDGTGTCVGDVSTAIALTIDSVAPDSTSSLSQLVVKGANLNSVATAKLVDKVTNATLNLIVPPAIAADGSILLGLPSIVATSAGTAYVLTLSTIAGASVTRDVTIIKGDAGAAGTAGAAGAVGPGSLHGELLLTPLNAFTTVFAALLNTSGAVPGLMAGGGFVSMQPNTSAFLRPTDLTNLSSGHHWPAYAFSVPAIAKVGGTWKLRGMYGSAATSASGPATMRMKCFSGSTTNTALNAALDSTSTSQVIPISASVTGTADGTWFPFEVTLTASAAATDKLCFVATDITTDTLVTIASLSLVYDIDPAK